MWYDPSEVLPRRDKSIYDTSVEVIVRALRYTCDSPDHYVAYVKYESKRWFMYVADGSCMELKDYEILHWSYIDFKMPEDKPTRIDGE